MPEVSGFEVLRKIRQRSAHIPVLVLTMHHDIGTLRMAMAGGAAGYLLKSAVSEELRKRLGVQSAVAMVDLLRRAESSETG